MQEVAPSTAIMRAVAFCVAALLVAAPWALAQDNQANLQVGLPCRLHNSKLCHVSNDSICTNWGAGTCGRLHQTVQHRQVIHASMLSTAPRIGRSMPCKH